MAREFRGKIPKIPIDADTSRADAKIDKLFDKVENLQDIKIDANVNQAQRRLETLAKKTGSDISKELFASGMKDFKLLLGAMKTELNKKGTSPIYQNLEKTYNMFVDKFSDITIDVGGKSLNGLLTVLNDVADFSKIENIGFTQAVADSEQILETTKKTAKEIKKMQNKSDPFKVIKAINRRANSNDITGSNVTRLQTRKGKLLDDQVTLSQLIQTDNNQLKIACEEAQKIVEQAIEEVEARIANVQKNVQPTKRTAKQKKDSDEVRIFLEEFTSLVDEINASEVTASEFVRLSTQIGKRAITAADGIKQMRKAMEDVRKEATQTNAQAESSYKSFGERIQAAKAEVLGKELIGISYGFGNNVDEVEEKLTAVQAKMSEIKDEAAAAKEEFDALNSTIVSYIGNQDWKKSDFQNAIKDQWRQGNKSTAAKLFESYQAKFPEGKFDPAKQFGSEWADNFAQSLEVANRDLVYFRNRLDATAEAYGKFMALKSLEDSEKALITRRDRLKSEADQKAQEEQKKNSILHKAQKDYSTHDIVIAQNNLNRAIDEYNTKLEKANNLLAEKRRLESLDGFESEPWYREDEAPIKHIYGIATAFSDALGEANDFKIALKEAVRVYRELGGDMELPFADESLLKEIDTPIKEQVRAIADVAEESAKAQKKLQKAYLDSRKVYEVHDTSSKQPQIYPTRGKAETVVKNITGLGWSAEIIEKYLGDVEESVRERFEQIYYQPSAGYKPGKTFTLSDGDLSTYVFMIEGLEDFKSQYTKLHKLLASGATSANIKPSINMLDTFGFMLNESSDIYEPQIELLERILAQRISDEDRLNGLLSHGRGDVAGTFQGANKNSTWAQMARNYDGVSQIQAGTETIEERIEKTEELADATRSVTKAQEDLQKTYSVETQKQIQDLERSIKNQKDWLKYLEPVLDENKFKTSGKKAATEQLREETAKWIDYRRNGDNGVSQYRKEILSVAWTRAYREAERQGVAQSTLNRYYTDAGYDYDDNLRKLQEAYDFRKNLLEKDQTELNRITQVAEEVTSDIESVAKSAKKLLLHAGYLSDIENTMPSFPLGHVEPRVNGSGISGLTGLYTISNNPENVKDSNGFAYNEWHGLNISAIDPSFYKLFDATNEEIADKLGTFVSELHATIYGFARDAFTGDMIDISTLKTVEELYTMLGELVGDINMDFETFKKFVTDSQAVVAGAKFEYHKFPSIDEGIAKSSVAYLLKGVSEKVFNSDSFGTQLLKQLGFEGYDVSGTKYDGTYTGGSVLFTVKPESIVSRDENWSDVMKRIGLNVTEQDLAYEKKRQQLAIDTAKVYNKTAQSSESITQEAKSTSDLLNDIADSAEAARKDAEAAADAFAGARRGQGRGQTYSGMVYSGSKTPLEDITYDPSVGDGWRNLGEAWYVSSDLSVAADYGKHIIQKAVELKNVFMLAKDAITSIDDLYAAMGRKAPENADWDTISSDLGQYVTSLSNVKDFTRRMQIMGYDAIRSIGYGFGDDDNSEQMAIYDQEHWKHLSTVPFSELQNQAAAAGSEIQLLENKVKSLVETTKQIPQEPNTTRFVHFTDSINNKSILANGLGLSAGMFQSHAVEIQEYVDVLENGVEAASRATNVLKSHGDLGNAVIMDIPNDSIIAYDSAVGGLETVSNAFVKAIVNTENGLVDLNAKYDAAHDVVIDYTEAVREAKEAEASTISRRPGVKRSDSMESVMQRIIDNRGAVDIKLPELTFEERQVTLNSGVIDELFKNYNITDSAEQQYVYDAFAEMGQITKAIWTKISTDGKIRQDDELFVHLHASLDKAAEAIMMFGTRTEDVSDDLKNFYSFMSGKKLKYDEDIKTEFGDSWKDFYNKYKGRLTPSPTGLDVNKLYQHLAGIDSDGSSLPQSNLDTFRGLFPSDIINPKDQFEFIFKMLGEANAARSRGWKNPVVLDDMQPVSDDVHKIQVQMSKQLQASMEGVLDTERQIEAAVENTNEDLAQSARLEKQAADSVQEREQEIELDDAEHEADNKSDILSIVDIDTKEALEQLRTAFNNKTNLIDLSTVFTTDALEAEISSMATEILGKDTKLSLGSVVASGDIARITLYNKELGVTLSQVYQLRKATEDAQKASLEHLPYADTYKHDVKAVKAYDEAQKTKIVRDDRWLLQQLSKLDTQERKYKYSGKKIAGSTVLERADKTTLKQDADKTIDSLVDHIKNSINGAMGEGVTDSLRNNILNDLRILDNEIKVQQYKQYASTTMKPTELEEAKKEMTYMLDALESKAKKNNVFTQMSKDLGDLREKLKKINDGAQLGTFVDSLRTTKSQLASEIAKEQQTKKEESNYQNLLKAQEKLYEARKKLAVLEVRGEADSIDGQNAKRDVADLQEKCEAVKKLVTDQEKLNAAINRGNELEKELNATREKAEFDNIKSIYNEMLGLISQINGLDTKMNDLTFKDQGTGLYTGAIQNLQTQKSYLVNDFENLHKELAKTLSITPQEGQNAFAEFLSDARVQAALTVEEVQNIQKAFMQTEDVRFNFGAKLSQQIQPVVEKVAQLKQLIESGAITDANTIAKVKGMDAIIHQQSQSSNVDELRYNAISLMEYINYISDDVSRTLNSARKEMQYFANKKQYANISNIEDYSRITNDIENVSESAVGAKQKLESFVNTFASGKAVITGFTTSADGISKIDFSVLEEGTNQFRTFSAEMGTYTNNVYTFETSMKNLRAGTDAAKKSLATLSEAMARLNQLQNDNPDLNVGEQSSKLWQTMQNLQAELANVGDSKDAGSQTKLKNLAVEAQKSAKEVAKLEQQWAKTMTAIDSIKLQNVGVIDQNGDIYAQMYAKIKAAAGEAIISNVKFDESTKTLSYTLTDADKNTTSMTAHMDQLTGTVTTQQGQVGKLKNMWQDIGNSLGGIGKEALRYVGNMLDVASIIQGLRQGFNTVKEIDTALTELRKVTDETDASYARFLQNMSKTGAAVGSTVKDLATSAADWGRLGYSLEEAGKLAENTMILMNVSEFDNVSTATDTLVSALQAFKDESSDADTLSMKIIDVFNQIGNSYAISTSDLADSLTRSSASLVAANNTLEQSVALTTAANTIIQNPETVGTTLKTLAMRIRGVKTE